MDDLAGIWLWSFVGLFILGTAVYFAAPLWPRDVAGVLRARPGRSFLAGLLLLFLAPVAIVALAFWSGGEWILAAMSAAGALVTIAVGLSTLVRG